MTSNVHPEQQLRVPKVGLICFNSTCLNHGCFNILCQFPFEGAQQFEFGPTEAIFNVLGVLSALPLKGITPPEKKENHNKYGSRTFSSEDPGRSPGDAGAGALAVRGAAGGRWLGKAPQRWLGVRLAEILRLEKMDVFFFFVSLRSCQVLTHIWLKEHILQGYAVISLPSVDHEHWHASSFYSPLDVAGCEGYAAAGGNLRWEVEARPSLSAYRLNWLLTKGVALEEQPPESTALEELLGEC